jgi:prepilin-type processing-associated H-X9-DG protein
MTEREILFEALEIDTPEARAAYLQGACGKDVSLRRNGDDLLKEHFSNDSLLAGPALDGERRGIIESPAEEAPAQMIGRYKLLEKIGEGCWVTGHAKWDTGPANIERGTLYPYVGSAGPYGCPADRSFSEDHSGEILDRRRTRRYSMSGSIHCTKWRSEYSFQRTGSVNQPGPSEVFLHLDVNEQSISDGHFKIVNPGEHAAYGSQWISLPADRHSRGCNLSFVDGHAATWKWLAPKKWTSYFQTTSGAEDEKDLRRLQRGIKQQP